MAEFFSDGVAIDYVLPVSWMTLCFHSIQVFKVVQVFVKYLQWVKHSGSILGPPCILHNASCVSAVFLSTRCACSKPDLWPTSGRTSRFVETHCQWR